MQCNYKSAYIRGMDLHSSQVKKGSSSALISEGTSSNITLTSSLKDQLFLRFTNHSLLPGTDDFLQPENLVLSLRLSLALAMGPFYGNRYPIPKMPDPFLLISGLSSLFSNSTIKTTSFIGNKIGGCMAKLTHLPIWIVMTFIAKF